MRLKEGRDASMATTPRRDFDSPLAGLPSLVPGSRDAEGGPPGTRTRGLGVWEWCGGVSPTTTKREAALRGEETERPKLTRGSWTFL